MTQEQTQKRAFLPLGSVVILNGSVKKLIIVSRASIVEDEFFDYGAALYPEGMIDSKIAYFSRETISKIVHEGYTDSDEELVQEILANAYSAYQTTRQQPQPAAAAQAPTAAAVAVDDPFASVRDLADTDD